MGVCRYIPHLKSLVGPLPNEDIEWVDASNQLPNFLGYDATETLGYEFSGTASVVAIDRSAIEALEPQKGMDLLLDLRKRVTRGDVIQAQAKLLLANLHAPERRPVLVCPDLCIRGVPCGAVACLDCDYLGQKAEPSLPCVPSALF